jgi:hypothetical protein
MPPKPSAAKDRLVDEEEEVLQAVILADSFNSRFKPLTIAKPRVVRLSILLLTTNHWDVRFS